MRDLGAGLVGVALWLLLLATLAGTSGCESEQDMRLRYVREAAELHAAESAAMARVPCVEETTLLATTAGSPDDVKCKHPRHVIETKPATLAGEEIGVVVVCRCLGKVQP